MRGQLDVSSKVQQRGGSPPWSSNNPIGGGWRWRWRWREAIKEKNGFIWDNWPKLLNPPPEKERFGIKSDFYRDFTQYFGKELVKYAIKQWFKKFGTSRPRQPTFPKFWSIVPNKTVFFSGGFPNANTLYAMYTLLLCWHFNTMYLTWSLWTNLLHVLALHQPSDTRYSTGFPSYPGCFIP